MDMQDLDEEERARRKKEMVEYRTKKTRSTVFMLCASVFEIVETIVIMLALFLLMSFIVFRVGDPNSRTVQIVFEVLSILIFIGSMVAGFFIYKFAVRAVITKFNLKDKLMNDVIEHYIKPEKDETEEALKR